jgi:hypothetical protein
MIKQALLVSTDPASTQGTERLEQRPSSTADRKIRLFSKAASDVFEPPDTTPEKLVGEEARIRYFSSLKTLPKMLEIYEYSKRDISPSMAYLKTTERLNLSPRPNGVIRRKGSNDVIDIH